VWHGQLAGMLTTPVPAPVFRTPRGRHRLGPPLSTTSFTRAVQARPSASSRRDRDGYVPRRHAPAPRRRLRPLTPSPSLENYFIARPPLERTLAQGREVNGPVQSRDHIVRPLVYRATSTTAAGIAPTSRRTRRRRTAAGAHDIKVAPRIRSASFACSSSSCAAGATRAPARLDPRRPRGGGHRGCCLRAVPPCACPTFLPAWSTACSIRDHRPRRCPTPAPPRANRRGDGLRDMDRSRAELAPTRRVAVGIQRALSSGDTPAARPLPASPSPTRRPPPTGGAREYLRAHGLATRAGAASRRVRRSPPLSNLSGATAARRALLPAPWRLRCASTRS